jgi:putative superfamily III holin-X
MSVARAPLPGDQETVGVLVQRLGTDVGRIVRAEIGLVQLRATSALPVVKAAGSGLVAAAVLGIAGFGALTAGVVLIVATVLPAWLAALAVGGGLLVIAAVLVGIEVHVLNRGVGEALSPIEGGAEVSHGG